MRLARVDLCTCLISDIVDATNNVYSKRVKAGRRTYFIDLKETRGGGFYLVVSESRKNLHEDGKVSYTKSKVFVYPEDVSRFCQGIEEAFEKMKKSMPNYDFAKFERRDAAYDERDQDALE